MNDPKLMAIAKANMKVVSKVMNAAFPNLCTQQPLTPYSADDFGPFDEDVPDNIGRGDTETLSAEARNR